MTTDEGKPKRSPNKAFEATRRARASIAPYLSQFPEWNRRAAHLTIVATSSLRDSSFGEEQKRQLAELFEEVDAAYQSFERELAGQRHGRIDDIRAAFQRLIAMLNPWRRSDT
jgi:hypothetical protein